MRIANRAGVALLTAALLTLIFVAFVFERDDAEYTALNDATDRVHDIVDTAKAALSALKDAETGQRGFLLTGDSMYLSPYDEGIRNWERSSRKLRELTGDQASVEAIQRWGGLKVRELALTLRIFREEGASSAIARVRLGLGRAYMDRLRELTGELVAAFENVHRHNSRALSELEQGTRTKISVATLVLFLFTAAGSLLLFVEIRRERRTAARLVASRGEYRDLAENLERKVEARTRSLKQTNDELLAFSYSVSHDLRAPLRSIDGFSQMILEDYGERLDHTGRDMLRRVRAGAKRMGELIQSLLSLSRVTRQELQRSEVPVSAIAETILAELAGASGRQVEIEVEPAMEADADPQLIRIVLENLLSNAWKFTGNVAEPRIQVGRTESRGRRVFFVRDNGAGFDSSHAERLFTPFQRFHTEGEFEGTGIGLATVQRIVNRHGGSIWAESRPGAGATFYFVLN